MQSCLPRSFICLTMALISVGPIVIMIIVQAIIYLFLNLAAAITANDTLTCTGTVTVYYVDLGNLSS